MCGWRSTRKLLRPKVDFEGIRARLVPTKTLVLTGLATFEMVGTRKQPGTSRNAACGYAASRISSNLEGSTKQFGSWQALASDKRYLGAIWHLRVELISKPTVSVQ